jgi:3-oxoacyl-[acyl-carrier-protein] synthase II
MSKKVVITGLGIFSPLGNSVDLFWKNALNGLCAIKPIPEHWHTYFKYRSKYYAPLSSWDPLEYAISNQEQLWMDCQTQLCLGAAHQAILDAELPLKLENPKLNQFQINADVGVYIGSAGCGLEGLLNSHTHYVLSKHLENLKEYKEFRKSFLSQRLNYYSAVRTMSDACSSAIGIKYQVKGPNQTYCSGCASSTVAMGHAYRSIQRGECSVAITGGADYLKDDLGAVFASFDITGVLASEKNSSFPNINRPFDSKRSGFLFSEGGAGVLIFEELEHALKRKATIYGEVIGYGESYSPYRVMMIEPEGESLREATKRALSDADHPTIDYINAHGTGTINNDLTEAKMIKELFPNNPYVNSTKSLIGHSICACGGIEGVVCALSLKEGLLHPSLNIEEPVENLNFIKTKTEASITTALSASFSFGGQRSVIIFQKV